jgi:hypothetical protein
VQQGREEQARLVEATAVHTRAVAEADRMLDQAHAEAEAMRLQTEDYVDAKLANFENVLSTTLATVQRGVTPVRPARARPAARRRPRRVLARARLSRAAAPAPIARPVRSLTDPESPSCLRTGSRSTASTPVSPSSSTRASWGAVRGRCARCG